MVHNNRKTALHGPYTRQLTISHRFHQRRSLRSDIVVLFPEIRLQGKWLQELGFGIGQAITVACQFNKITITLAPGEQPEGLIHMLLDE